MNPPFPGRDCEGLVIDGKFRLLRWLGGTNQSAVFLTELEDDPAKKATIKLIPVYSADRQACEAYWGMAKALSNPHLVRFLDSGYCEIDDTEMLYAVTEYADEVLSEILPQRPLTPEETRAMLSPVLDALSYLHGKGLVHGHLKPSNVLVVNDQVKLSVDRIQPVGPAKRSSAEDDAWVPPDSANMTLSPAANVWSLGVLLMEALTQQQPKWERASGLDPVVPDFLPQPFLVIARKCLRISPSLRCTLPEISAQLAVAPLAEPVAAPTEQRAEMEEKAPPRHRAKMIGGAVLVLLAVFAILELSHRQSQVPASQPPASQTPAPSTAETAATPPQTPEKDAPSPSTSVVKGSVAQQVMPEVPSIARDTISGHVHVTVLVHVDADGAISKAAIDSEGPSRYFAERALKAARQWQFVPARVGERAVASTWLLKFRFGREATVVTPEETSP